MSLLCVHLDLQQFKQTPPRSKISLVLNYGQHPPNGEVVSVRTTHHPMLFPWLMAFTCNIRKGTKHFFPEISLSQRWAQHLIKLFMLRFRQERTCITSQGTQAHNRTPYSQYIRNCMGFYPEFRIKIVQKPLN